VTDALELRDVTAGYGGAPAVSDASLSIAPGRVSAILGANGAGKTTLLRAVSGGLRRSAGEVLCGGQALPAGRPDEALRAGVAHVLEGRHIFATLTVEENLWIGGDFLPPHARREQTRALYDLFPDLARLRRQSGGDLSGGQQQMLAIARALMSRPSVLMLDEPSLGLSPRLVELLTEHLEALRAAMHLAVLLVEQTVWVALDIADDIFLMDRGSLRYLGRPRDLDAETISASYLAADGATP
jgi:branched-chain amino acid transport system ATP-binding protein